MEIKKTETMQKYVLDLNFQLFIDSPHVSDNLQWLLNFGIFDLLTPRGSQGHPQNTHHFIMLSQNIVHKACKVYFSQSWKMCLKKLVYQKCDYLWTRLYKQMAFYIFQDILTAGAGDTH